MHVKRRLPNFESCSVALFASLALGGAAHPARSQTPSAPHIASPTSAVPATSLTVRSSPAGSDQLTPASTQSGAFEGGHQVSQQLAQSFRSADLDGDGLLSREETSGWPAVWRDFDRIDTNKDGSISSTEFDEALK
jgi:hypothetical protein